MSDIDTKKIIGKGDLEKVKDKREMLPELAKKETREPDLGSKGVLTDSLPSPIQKAIEYAEGDKLIRENADIVSSVYNDVEISDYMGFEKLTKNLEGKGASNPKALASWIGRRKYGDAGFNRRISKGVEGADFGAALGKIGENIAGGLEKRGMKTLGKFGIDKNVMGAMFPKKPMGTPATTPAPIAKPPQTMSGMKTPTATYAKPKMEMGIKGSRAMGNIKPDTFRRRPTT